MEWIILEKPYLLTIIIIAILINCFDKAKKASKGVLTFISALLYVAVMAFLCVDGAGYHELIVLVLVFLLFNFDTVTEWRTKE